MDTSTFCDSTSTPAPVKLGLRLLTCAPPGFAFRFDMTVDCVAYELLSCRFGRFRLHTSLRLRALIRSWQGVYVCKSRCTRTRFQFKKPHSGEHSSEPLSCVRKPFRAFINPAEVFFLRWFSEVRKKHFRRNFRKCSRMRPNMCTQNGLYVDFAQAVPSKMLPTIATVKADQPVEPRIQWM